MWSDTSIANPDTDASPAQNLLDIITVSHRIEPETPPTLPDLLAERQETEETLREALQVREWAFADLESAAANHDESEQTPADWDAFMREVEDVQRGDSLIVTHLLDLLEINAELDARHDTRAPRPPFAPPPDISIALVEWLNEPKNQHWRREGELWTLGNAAAAMGRDPDDLMTAILDAAAHRAHLDAVEAGVAALITAVPADLVRAYDAVTQDKALIDRLRTLMDGLRLLMNRIPSEPPRLTVVTEKGSDR